MTGLIALGASVVAGFVWRLFSQVLMPLPVVLLNPGLLDSLFMAY